MATIVEQRPGSPPRVPAAPVEAARDLVPFLRAQAAGNDRSGAYPHASMLALHRAGLAAAPLPDTLGGAGLGSPAATASLFDVLRTVGSGDLSVGRLFEGHVNAVMLAERFGTPAQLAALAGHVRGGGWSAVWSAEGRDGLTAERHGDRWHLTGRKILCSGAGSIGEPMVVATWPGRGPVLVMPGPLDPGRVDLDDWQPLGMRCTATGTVDLSGMSVDADCVLGDPGDYGREPWFRGGAWRFCAVQLGAVETLVDLYREHLRATRRMADPFQLQRVAQCCAVLYGATLGTERAALAVASPTCPPADAVTLVGLSRMLVERAATEVVDHVQRGVGLRALIQPNPIERVIRDLSTYLRQPLPDTAMTDAAGHALTRTDPVHRIWSDEG